MSLNNTEDAVVASATLEPAPLEPKAPTAADAQPSQLARHDLQSSFGNALLAAAATGDSPPDSTRMLSHQFGFGNAAVSRSLIQRKAEGTGSSNATSPATASPADTSGAGSRPTASTQSLIVEDTAETVQPGQMKKTEFLTRLRTALHNTADETLAGTPWSSAAGPQIDRGFTQYSAQSSEQLERTIRAQVPEAANVASASDLISTISSRARRMLAAGIARGGIGGLPPGATSSLVGGVQGAIGGAVAGITGAASALAGGIGGALSSVGSLLFKERGDGARETQDPAAIQSQLGAGHPLDGSVRSQMESAFGQSFGGVEVHTDANASGLSENLNARAFTVGQHIAFSAGEYQPGTLIGDALIAHELAHVMQQNGGGASAAPAQKGTTEYGDLEEDADEAAVGAVVSVWGGAKKGLAKVGKKALPKLKSGLNLQRCDWCGGGSAPAALTTTDVRFSDLQRVWPTLTTPAQKEAALVPAIDSARRRASQLFRTAASDPILAIRRRIEGGIHVDVEDNPLIGVTQDNVEQAYRAWAEGAGLEPWMLLALWAKEGIGKDIMGRTLTNPANVSGTIAASTADNAKSLYRSRFFYWRLGTDHFMHTIPSSGDNQASFRDADAPLHETDFRAAVAAQVTAGRLARDISGDINAAMTAAPAGPGQFLVTPSSQFFTLALVLAGAYFRENAAALAADPRVGANPDPGLTYMRWNMGATRFAPFIPSAEGHRMEPQYTMPGGRQPSLTEWAFEREPREEEFGQARRNAIRFRYFVEVFRLIYEGW